VLQLEQSDAITALLRWAFLRMQRVKGLPGDALGGRKLFIEDLSIDQGHQARYKLQVLIQLRIFGKRWLHQGRVLIFGSKALVLFLFHEVVSLARYALMLTTE